MKERVFVLALILVALVTILVLVSCVGVPNTAPVVPEVDMARLSSAVVRYYDKEYDVICYVYLSSGISCLSGVVK